MKSAQQSLSGLKLDLQSSGKMQLLLVIVWPNRKWTGSGSGISVTLIWSKRTESQTPYTPASDCYLWTFWHWKCHIYALAYV